MYLIFSQNSNTAQLISSFSILKKTCPEFLHAGQSSGNEFICRNNCSGKTNGNWGLSEEMCRLCNPHPSPERLPLFTCTLHSIFKTNLSILTASPNRCCMREKCYSCRCVTAPALQTPHFAEAELTRNYTKQFHFFNTGGLGIKSTGTVQSYRSRAVKLLCDFIWLK